MKSSPSLACRVQRVAAFALLVALPLSLALVAVAPPAPAEEARTAARSQATTRSNVVWHTDFEQARRVARRTGKPILANFSGSDWCGWCIRLDREVFRTTAFKQWAAKNVILLEVDFPRRGQPAAQTKKNRALQARYGVQGFPTVLFLDASGKALGRSGYRKGGPSAWTQDADRRLLTTRPV